MENSHRSQLRQHNFMATHEMLGNSTPLHHRIKAHATTVRGKGKLPKDIVNTIPLLRIHDTRRRSARTGYSQPRVNLNVTAAAWML